LTQVKQFAFVRAPVESAQRLTCVKNCGLAACNNDGMKATVEMFAAPVTVHVAAKVKNDLAGGRLAREWKTMSAMVRIYCRGHHHPAEGLCAECRQFLDYAEVRLERCRFGEAKPTCANCPVHCYQRDRREQARVVMRYAGPRMMWEHPVMSLRHWLDGFRNSPQPERFN
jgi:hypothetical protein